MKDVEIFQTTISVEGINNIVGTSADETIAANTGSDTLTGNGGADIFVYDNISDGNDTITDFVIGDRVGADKLDLSALLTGENSSNLANFLQVSDSNGATDKGDITIKIDVDGGGSFSTPDITLILTAAGISGGETTLGSLINDNIIIS